MRRFTLLAVLQGLLAFGCGGSDEPGAAEPVEENETPDPPPDPEPEVIDDEPEDPPPAEAPPAELIVEELPTATLNSTRGATIGFPAMEGADSVTLVMGGVGDRWIGVSTLVAPDGALVYDAWDPALETILAVHQTEMVLQLPFSPEQALAVGEYTVNVASSPEEIVEAWGLLVTRIGGDPDRSRLDVVHHFVAQQDLGATSAEADPDFAAARTEMYAWLDEAGIEVVTERFEDLDEPELVHLTSTEGPSSDLARLLAYAPNERALHMFWVDEIDDDDGPILGISGGLPGAPGVAGTSSSGVAVATLDLRDDPQAVGSTAAHEALHFLGLFHTTEACVDAELGCAELHDPLSDTPRCTADRDRNHDGILDYWECLRSDGENLMFWQAGAREPFLTVAQGQIVRRSAFTY